MVLLVRLRARCVRAPVGRCDGSNCQRCCWWCIRAPGAFARPSAALLLVVHSCARCVRAPAVLLVVHTCARCVRAPVSGIVVGGAFVRPVRPRARQCVRRQVAGRCKSAVPPDLLFVQRLVVLEVFVMVFLDWHIHLPRPKTKTLLSAA